MWLPRRLPVCAGGGIRFLWRHTEQGLGGVFAKRCFVNWVSVACTDSIVSSKKSLRVPLPYFLGCFRLNFARYVWFRCVLASDFSWVRSYSRLTWCSWAQDSSFWWASLHTVLWLCSVCASQSRLSSILLFLAVVWVPDLQRLESLPSCFEYN